MKKTKLSITIITIISLITAQNIYANTKATQELCKRLLGNRADEFIFKQIPKKITKTPLLFKPLITKFVSKETTTYPSPAD